ncbi:WecB/TagA/CpsF family glycosyltransferase [Terrilactibacillus sp. BCM23-1]|uniref:WecB/TagA/CpsF family glycosyltransferase n=1 Tax=Terrilactibacillus tamarindi TaxID=2599694 RepID=A0A6N8CQJ8_9BACI|nr:WecB/TagA/CpsF family glycosyltransferase [Terrilactibacillus tamarindi]MTT31363.1 WecB/TagA/CpsF family glycosyltransferase [Terrilactibacillus tamarindi]
MNKKYIGNIGVSVITKDRFLNEFVEKMKGGSKKNIFFLNDHCFNIAQKDADYLNYLNHADYVLNDGLGITLGAKLFNIELKENLNGTDLMPHVLKTCENLGASIFLLGAKEENIEAAVSNIQASYPHLQIAGYHHGYFNSDERIIEKINQSKADVLIVGMGVPLQEKFIGQYDQEIHPPVRFAVGAFIDFASGNVPRAPKLMRKLNLEWLFRMAREPRRMWKRNFIGHGLFFINVLRLKKQKNTK